MKARVLRPFIDKKEGVVRSVGDTFVLSAKRYAEINATSFGALVDEVQSEISKPKRPTKG